MEPSGNTQPREEITIGAEDVRHRFLGWAKDDPVGSEFASVRLSPDSLWARGVAMGVGPVPYLVDYELTTGAEHVTTGLTLKASGTGWWRRLELSRSAGGEWTARGEHEGDVDLPPPGGDVDAVAGALDPDLELSPVFNSMPVLRHGLHEEGEVVEFLMVWVSLPDLRLHPSRQRYAHLGKSADGRVVRFEALDDGFVAEIVYDDDGLVVDYPGIGRRILPDPGRPPHE